MELVVLRTCSVRADVMRLFARTASALAPGVIGPLLFPSGPGMPLNFRLRTADLPQRSAP